MPEDKHEAPQKNASAVLQKNSSTAPILAHLGNATHNKEIKPIVESQKSSNTSVVSNLTHALPEKEAAIDHSLLLQQKE